MEDNMKLSKNFTLSELTRSNTAEREGIVNKPSEEQIENLKFLTNEILQPVRDHFNSPVHITSGFRNDELNEAVGGSDTSQHRTGEAADFYVTGHESIDVARWIQDNLVYHQIILYKSRGHVHVGIRRQGNNRMEVLTSDNGSMTRGLG